MPFCRHCKNELGKRKKFQSNRFNEKYCLETEGCIRAWRDDRISGEAKAREKKQKADWKEQKKVLREKTTNYKDKLQKEVQLIARLIDNRLPCLATGKHGQMHGGHIFSKGAHPQMRFNLHNVHRQCAESNTYSSDDGLMREMLENEYGTGYLEFVKSLRSGEIPKLKNDDYKEIYLKARKISNRMKMENRQFDVLERIEARNAVNAELSIYQPEFCAYKALK